MNLPKPARPPLEDLSHLNPAPPEGRGLAKVIRELATKPGAALRKDTGITAASINGARSQWMEVTPELAAEWLKRNVRNRPCTVDTVAAYARDMRAGHWAATHQGLAFNDRDELIDGQHRLAAVLLAGVPVRMMVTFDLPAQVAGQAATTMDSIDRGKPRSLAHQLALQHGLKEASLIAAVATQVAALCSGERTRRLSVAQALAVYHEFQASTQFIIEHRCKSHGFRSAGLLAAFVLAHATEAGKIAPLFDAFNDTAVALAPGSPLAKLRAFITSDEASLMSRSHDRALAEFALQALYLEINGHPARELVPDKLDGANWFKALQPARIEKIAALFRLPV